MHKEHDTVEPTLDLALWRYGIISALLHGHGDERSLTQKIEQLAAKSYLRPDGLMVQPTAETMRKWLYRYRHGGLPALENQVRSDKGRQNIPQTIVEAMHQLRANHPRWTIATMLQHLLEAGLWNGRKPSESSLYRFAVCHNLQRDPHLSKADAATAPFAYDAFGQLWIADFLHGPKIRQGRYQRKTLLHMIIDDASRWAVEGGFGFGETVEVLIDGLMKAVSRFGIPARFYVDNGPCYKSHHLKMACARAGIHLVHTPAYRPQGRGKVERFFRTVRDQFLSRNEAKTLETLNADFARWLSGYHQRIHSSLECSPLKKRLSIPNVCKPVPETTDLEALFRMQRRCRVYKDGTIRLKNKAFEVPAAVPGSRVNAYYMPWDLSRVYYGQTMQLAREVDLSANAHRFDHPGGHR